MEADITCKVVNAIFWNIRFVFSALDAYGTYIMIEMGRMEPIGSRDVLSIGEI
jgi:hypothetical protein